MLRQAEHKRAIKREAHPQISSGYTEPVFSLPSHPHMVMKCGGMEVSFPPQSDASELGDRNGALFTGSLLLR